MKDVIYKYIYKVAMGVLALSFVLLLFVSGKAPFGLTASWSSAGLGNSLVFTYPDATATIGQSVSGSALQNGGVAVYTVEETLRREGRVFYRVSDLENNELMTIAAQELGKGVLFSIPFVGVFARMLQHVVGVMTLIGLPLFMVSINYALQGIKQMNSQRSLAERTTQRESDETKKEKAQQAFVQTEDDVEEKYVTVLKPYNLRKTFSQ